MYRQSFQKSKYGNVKTNGYDSKFEASYAQELELRQAGKDILGFDTQYKIELRANGKLICNYYCDFRVHELDGSFTLVETKGYETDVYRFKRRLLEALWLPEHPDHDYVVVKQQNTWRPKK